MTDAPKKALGGRFHFVAPFRYQVDTPRWLARDERTGEHVVVAFVEAARVAKLEAIKGFSHPHLGAIVDVVHGFEASEMLGGRAAMDGALAVAEHVSGPTLRQQLEKEPVNPARVVAWWLRLAEATALVHKQGGVLGGISPFSVIGRAEGRAIPPVLTQLTAPVVGAALSPERLKGNPPEAIDDVWALYASLYWALTGVAPFPGNSRDALQKDILAGPPTPVSAFGIRESELEEIIQRGLIAEPAQRAAEIDELIKSLDAWERGLRVPPRPTRVPQLRSLSGIVKGGLSPRVKLGRVAFDAAVLPNAFGPEDYRASSVSNEPLDPEPTVNFPTSPLPHHSAPVRADLESSPAVETPSTQAQHPSVPPQPSVNPFAKKRSAWPLLVGAVLFAAGAVGFFSLNRPQASPQASAVNKLPAPTKVAGKPRASATPQRHSPIESLNTCIKSYFADGTFAAAAQLGFVCEAGDHRDITTKLYELSEAINDREAALAAAQAEASAEGDQRPDSAPPKGFKVDTVTGDNGAERMRRPLGWYELLSTAVVRKGCCPNAAQVVLPETIGWCEQLQDVVRDLADDSVRSGDLAPRVKRFDKAVDCLFANRVRRPYKEYKLDPLTEGNRSAFQQFLSHAAVSDAKRRTLGR
jgi:hypothetical protein